MSVSVLPTGKLPVASKAGVDAELEPTVTQALTVTVALSGSVPFHPAAIAAFLRW